ncbi:protein-glutamate methylesterase/protein-glutamine glutaminase [Virgibacillus ainsalahensis]
MHSIKVVVIDDSPFMRKVISNILESDNRIQVIATARNGEEGINKIRSLKPDVVTLDVYMPVMDGMETLQHVMKTNPVPVIMLSSITKAGTKDTIQAISNGAVDFITKPSRAISLDIHTIGQEIINKVIIASNVNMQRYKTGITSQYLHKTDYTEQLFEKTIIAIGTSTGGPRALEKVLKGLPEGFTPPILIVQHMPQGFTKSLAERLDSLSFYHVKEAEDGEIIKAKSAYIAPGNFHMKIRKTGTQVTIELSKDKPVSGHRPAVNVLLDSLSNLKNINKIAVILTGMGSDGSTGIRHLKNHDRNTIVIAESEETAVVYGMPKAAVKTGCVNYIVPLQKVGNTLSNLVK